MAQMPRGEPRTVPDPAGDAYDEMLREGRRKEGARSYPEFSPYGRIEAVRSAPQSPTITIGDQMYREVDNGLANRLVPYDPLYTPAERAAQRDGLVRTLFMAEHPLGTAAYGAATVARAPQKTRDAALFAGGLIDDTAGGAASRRGVVRPRPSSPQQARNLTRPRIVSRPPNEDGQASGGTATVISSVLSTGSKARRRIKPVGYVSQDEPWRHDRGHVIASWFGGSGRDGANLMTLERRANREHMKDFESDVARRVRGGETVEYSVTPLYEKGSLPPSMVLMTAFGHREGPKARLIRNPAGRAR